MDDTMMSAHDAELFCDGHSKDLSEIRKAGGHVRRPELDNQPTFKGYLGPMWNGTMIIDGEECAILRYETREVYDRLSM